MVVFNLLNQPHISQVMVPLWQTIWLLYQSSCYFIRDEIHHSNINFMCDGTRIPVVGLFLQSTTITSDVVCTILSVSCYINNSLLCGGRAVFLFSFITCNYTSDWTIPVAGIWNNILIKWCTQHIFITSYSGVIFVIKKSCGGTPY